MTPPIIAKLKQLAQAATPGPWMIHPNPRYWVLFPNQPPCIKGDPNRDANALYVSALSPEVVLALCAVVGAAKAMRSGYLPVGETKVPHAKDFDAALAALEKLP